MKLVSLRVRKLLRNYKPSLSCLLRGVPGDLPSRGIATGLRIIGNSYDGPFAAFCPQFRIKVTSDPKESPVWVVASPTNEAMIINYGASRPINNFDFRWGNATSEALPNRFTEQNPIVRVKASGRTVEFRWLESRSNLRRLLDSEILHTTALSAFSFSVWEGASEDDLVNFARHVSTLCAYGMGQYTGVPIKVFLDSTGKAIKRMVNTPVESTFRRLGVLDEAHVPNGISLLFEQCFDEHTQMCASKLPWRKLVSYCASVEDPPILEQKFASLMMALEFFIRNSLLEGASSLTTSQVESPSFSQLLGIARRTLGWKVPKHYAATGLVRLLRNAVMHGGELPVKDSREFRQTFDKWKLFLFRRVLIRLGYRGQVVSPHRGWISSSQVDDFSEEHNSYTWGD